MRLFVAATPPDELRRGLAELVRSLRSLQPPLPDAAWVRTENLHLTLAFLGEVAAEREQAVSAALGDGLAGTPALAARTGGLGAFPERGALSVVWLAVEPSAGLGALAGAVRGALDGAGVSYDVKSFRAHLTLARTRRRWPGAVRGRLAEVAPPPLAFPVRAVDLIESRLGGGSATYVQRARFPLVEEAA